MTPVRKIRSDAKLERLDADQRAQLRVWIDQENHSYVAVAALVRTHFGLSVGKDAVAAYWRRHVMPERRSDEARSVAVLAELSSGVFEAATLNHARLLAFDALVQPQPDIPKTVALMNMIDRASRLEIARQRQTLAQQRADLRRGPPVSARVPEPQGVDDQFVGRSTDAMALSASNHAATVPNSQNPALYRGYSDLFGDALAYATPSSCPPFRRRRRPLRGRLRAPQSLHFQFR